MKIECTLKRQGGTVIDLFGQTYHFQPDDSGSHVADVEDEQAIQRLLDIPESFRQFTGPAPVQLPPDTEPDDDEPTDYLLTNDDGSEVDLGKLNKDQLLAWAEANGIKVDKRRKLEDLLPAVFEAATKE